MEQSFTKVIDLIYLAKQEGIEIVLNEERLQLKIPENKIIDKNLLEEIRSNKSLIIDFLSNKNWKSRNVSRNHNKITSFDRKAVTQIPLSFSQERLWFIDQLEGSVLYNLPTVLRLKGRLNLEALSDALKMIVIRHEALRTVFREYDGQPSQFIREPAGWQLNIVDGNEYNHDAHGLQKHIDQLIRKPFDLANDYMMRADLITLSDLEYIVVVTMHHIASDAWSLPIIVREVVELYRAYDENRPVELPALEIQYADFAVWQRNHLKGDLMEKKIGYWKEKLDHVAALELPTDFARPAIRTTKGAISSYRIDKELASSIKTLSQQQGASLFMTLLAAYKILLHRYSGQQDISVGTSIAGRQPEEVVGLIGFFANTLALRTELNPDDSFIRLLQKVKQTTMDAYENQEVSFEKVVETVVKERDASRSPLFQVMLVLHNTPDVPQLQIGDVQLTNEAFENNVSKFDITFFLNENSNGLSCSVQYRTDLFKSETIDRMMDHFKELLSSLVKSPDQHIGSLPILTASEQQQLLNGFNDSLVSYPKDKTIVALFEQQAAKTPNETALVFEGQQFTYKQLSERSNQLAHYLKSRGVKEDSLVPLCVERSQEMIVGMLGILKAGAAYVPIEPDFPEDRKSFVLEDTAARVIVTSTLSASTLPSISDVDIIEIDDPFSAVTAQPIHNVQTALSPHNLAYVIYTSGSTGKPKGVMIEHRNLVDYVFGLNQSTSVDKCRSYALVSSIATDLGNTVIYSSLVFGGALHIFSKEAVSNIEYLHDYFSEHSIDCLKIVPSHWKALSAPGKLLLPGRLLVFGGEALQSELIEQIRLSGSDCSVVNHYGPTETTIGKLLHVVNPDRKYNKTIPIGKPFSNTRVYVLSKTLQLCPVGVGGELLIAGDGTARGYLNNPDLTKEKFIENPFDKQAGSLMYRTGDLVRWLADGNIEFIGRVDDQVKIRGYRVELGEIESILLQTHGVKQAIVLAKEDKDGNKRLVSYIVGTEVYDKESVISSLKERLPDYMVPGQWVEMDNFPLLPNGKIDRKSLPDPELSDQLGGQYIAPRNEVETTLAELWKDILEVERVGVNDDFFELGGHSLLAVRLISAIRKEFVVEMPISDIFDYPTVALLAAQLGNSSAAELLPAIEVVRSRPERIPLSFSQERLWFIDQLEGSVQYHVPSVLRLKGKLNDEALEYALRTIIDRHEVLRTVIVALEGKPYQEVKDTDGWTLSVHDGSMYKEDEKRLQQYILQLVKKPFDLSKDYLLRADLIKLNDIDHIIAVTMHHIASDAWSTPILVKEVVELYNSRDEGRPVQLSALPIQYADYSIWQRNYLQGDTLEKKLNFWKNKLEGASPLQLPVDFPRPTIQSTRGTAVTFKIDKDVSDKILQLTQQQGATLFMTLLAAYNILLHRYSGQQDIVVGTSIANRTQQDVEVLLGFFVNTLALRSQIDPEDSFIHLLQQVRQNTIDAYDHQDVPFEKVVEAVVKERDLSRSPLFQAMLDLQNAPEAPELRLGTLSLSPVPYELATSKFDITFFLHESASGLQGSAQYRTDLFAAETINRMIGHFQQLLRSITEAPQQKIGSLQMVTKAEQLQLLNNFNDTAVKYDTDRTIVDLFQEQVERNPDAIAVVFEDQQLTYKELNQRSNQLTGYLRTRGIKEETLVPICIERSLEMLVAILAILKAGAAYVPIDPEYPSDRISYLLEDTGASIVLSSTNSFSRLPDNIEADIIVPEDDWTVISLYPSNDKNINIQPNHPAYVIYTSGSTGKPKGVMIEHQNLLSYLVNNKTKYISSGKNSAGTFLHLSYTFDASVTGIFMPLIFGKSLVIGSKQSVNVFEDTNLHKYAPYDFIKITPSHLEILQPKMRTDYGSLITQKLVIGGEALLMTQFNSFIDEGIDVEIINEYGPTEATVGCSVYNFRTLDENQKLKNDISIGKPIDNVQIYILDNHLNLLPTGVPGEIFIAGAGVARGYLNRPDLTAERFLPNPFSNTWSEKMYKTGDLGRWLPDGNIEYLGRQDDQVKIRGYRIELGEIESVIQQSEHVKQAVVLAKNDTVGTKKLVAYVVPENEFDKDSIITYLMDKLPEYMVPTLWVSLESFPLTINGKIDKKSLPDPEAGGSKNTEYVAPRNQTEQKLAEIWQNLLEVEQVGVHDSFFELGGHSLLTVRLISAIRKEFVVELPISAIFDYPTVAFLAAQLDNTTDSEVLPAIEIVSPRPERIALSFSQERLWFIDQLEGSLQYHVPTVLRLKGVLNREALNNALRTLVNRHEILRTVIREEEGKPFQIVMNKDQWQLSILDGSKYVGDQKSLQRYIKELQTAPFDLSKDHVIRGHLIMFSGEDHVLVVTLHHIASDGWSRSVLVKELLELYNSLIENREPALPTLGIQYADYAIWQRNLFDGDAYKEKLDYWKNKLKEPTTLELPTDYPRPAVWSTRGATINFILEKELGEKLHALSQLKGTTLFMTLLAAFKVLAYRYSGQQDILIGSAIAGRQQQELEGLIGFFVNTLAFRSEISPDATFSEFLQQVKKTTIEAYAHQEVPFEKVVDAVLNQRSLSKNPLVQIMFALLNTPEVPELRLGDITLSREGQEHTSARFDITFFLSESPQGMTGSVEYATDLYNEDTIVRMIGHYKELLHNIVITPEEKISLLPILTRLEKDQLLIEFNQTLLPLQQKKTLVDLFEMAVQKEPDSLALAFESEKVTYKELNELSNQLAHYLIARGVGKESLVPICLDRSINLIIGFLGIMKSGAAYVPIDPRYPEDRIRFMLEDINADLIISIDSIISKLPVRDLNVISLDGDKDLISHQPRTKPNIKLLPTDLVNVIYTSGSTGQPKGVLVEHKGMVNMAGWYNHAFKVSAQSRFTNMTGVGFDAFGFEIWPCLTIGAALFIVDDDTRLDTAKLFTLVAQNEITHCLVPTALIQEFVSISKNKKLSLQYLLCGGDKLSSVEIEDLTYKVVNNYGPTEYSIVASSYELKARNKFISPAIGTPIANTAIYIVDQQNELVPIGVAGEICLSGDSIARGYLNSDALNSEKFVPDPFSKYPGSKMYRTGDIGRWLIDGNLEYIRRKDDQVKIRGHRIELGEIESVLQQTGLISKAVVLAKDVREGDKRLLSYLVPDWDVVKQKEHELYRIQVEGWKELYDTEYSKAESEENIDTEFNIVGWNDSFTKEAIPAEQMKEWQDDIIQLILTKTPGHVLEIGSGSGLIYYPLAEKVKKYIGTDLSRSSINQIQKRISKGLREYGPTELMVSAAHEVSLNENEQVDTIVINSVVQYFPGEDYLSSVIKKSISLLKSKGRIVIGDVRDNRLLRLFKSRLLLQRLQDAVNIKEFNWLVDQDTLNEEELCFSPDYFYHLPSVFPGITHVDIQWKRSSYINELTLYRYNVVLHVGMEIEPTEPSWRSWNDVTDYQTLLSELQNGSTEILALKNVPSHRLFEERLLDHALETNPAGTVGDLFQCLRKEDREGAIVKELLNTAQENGYSYRLMPNENPLMLNVLIEKQSSEEFIKNAYDYKDSADSAYTNIPLFANISLQLQREIRTLIQQRLPEYMIPSEMMIIGDLPLTRNGKIDKKFLLERKDKTAVNRLTYEAPRTEVEQILANIWQELLGVERIGIHDNFFELGGHSLLATRVVSTVRKQLYVELFIKDLFVYSTVAELASHLGVQSKGLLLPALEPQLRPQHIPLSFSQERLWFIDRLEGSVQYHLPAQMRLRGKIDKEALLYALRNIVNRHEVLRTVILEENGLAYQHVLPKDELQITEIDGSAYRENAEGLQNIINNFIADPFDLAKDHMLRSLLIRLNSQEHILVVTMHHISSDGWSISIIVKEVTELYNSYKEGTPVQLTSLPIQYADYSIWQRKNVVGEILENKIAYWKEKLHEVAPLQLPTDYSRPAFQSTRGSYTNFKINKELSSALVALSQQQGATLFMTLLTAFKVLLHRYSGQHDICVGTPIAGRQQQEVENLVGFFINTLALRTDLSGDVAFTELLQKVKTTTLEAYANQELPFEKVVDLVVKERNMARSPLFQVVFIFQNTPDVPTLHLGELQLIREASGHSTTKFELSFNISQTPQGIQGSVEYCTDLYNETTINRLTGHFIELLNSIVQTPKQRISSLRMLPQAETDQLLIDFNNNFPEYPRNKTIVDLIEEQVQKFPLNIAVSFGNDQLTYQQLNERSNRLAHLLRSKGVIADTLVPICVERNIEMIIGIVGILKAGGAYVPIDPDYPAERIQYMVEDTNASFVLASKDTIGKIKSVKEIEIFELDSEINSTNHPVTNLNTPIQPHHLAYVIYTSGSTGKPKGVLIEHRNVVRLFKTDAPLYDFNEKDVWSVFHSFCFDFSVWEMYGALFYGGRMVVVPKHITKDVTQFAELILKENVTILNQTPSAFYVLQDALIEKATEVPVRYVIFGGEALNPVKLQPWKQSYPNSKMINMYGITETTVHVTYQEINSQQIAGTKSIIGKPIPTLSVYIVDSNSNPVPIGVAGELLVGGAGLARGYLNRTELTAERFIQDPFGKDAGGRLYKTGDSGVWMPDGRIEYLGRIDEQVKIRGYRIELGEIETVLHESGLVSQVVVLAKSDKEGNKRLVGYIVPESSFNKEAVVSYLLSKLPDYMVPALWVEMERLPLTPNGKIDKKALPDPDASTLLKNDYVAPRTELEKNLAEIWRGLLGVDTVGIQDNFFELGGDSILTIQVVNRARRMGYELQPKDIFVHQTIGRLSEAIMKQSAVKVLGEQDILVGACGLTSIQQWFLQDNKGPRSHFNQSVLLGIDKTVPSTILNNAIEKLVAHHDALRFAYHQNDGEWFQEYTTRPGSLLIEDLQDVSKESLAAAITEKAEIYQRKLDIEKGPLFQIVLLQTPATEKENRLLFVVHHLAIDGVSWRILIENLEFLLTALQKNQKADLGIKTSSYRQWYEALCQYGHRRDILAQTDYWEKVLKSYRPLSIDKANAENVRLKDMGSQLIRLESEQTTKLLQDIPKVYHTEINDILLCALAMSLGDWGKTDKIIVGMEGHGREEISDTIDTSQTVGWFTSLYPVLIEIPREQKISDSIKSVKEQLRQVPGKGLSYGVLKYINNEKKLAAPAGWHIAFNYLGQFDNVVKTGQWFSGARESAGQPVSDDHLMNEQMQLTGYVQGGQLVLNWIYNTRNYEKEAINDLVQRFKTNLELLIDHCIRQQEHGAVFTPSDYALGAEISFEELDKFLDEPYNGSPRKESLEGLYRLSGLQQGMLFHGVYNERGGAYIDQFSCDLGAPDLNAFTKSWQKIIRHHSILRSAFYSDTFNIPVQCVYRCVDLPVTVIDYRGMTEIEQGAAIKKYADTDRMKGFDFKTAPLMRLALFRIKDDHYRMQWTSHHLLFDGWSLPILMEEFLSSYELLTAGRELNDFKEDRYEDYIRYIERFDKENEESYWRNYIKGIEQSTFLPFIEMNTSRTKGTGVFLMHYLNLNETITEKIKTYSQQNRITVNTIMQGVWAYLLHQYTGNKDVVYGVVVSGRPDDLPGVEQRVGMYINTLPLHSQKKHDQKIVDWLQQIQEDQVASRQYQFTPLQNIQLLSGVKGDLFDNILVFENYPVSKVIAEKKWSLNVRNVEMKEQTNYPLTITIGSSDQINIVFHYNSFLLKDEIIQDISNHFENVLLQLIANDADKLSNIKLLTVTEETKLIEEFNDTVSEFPSDHNIIDLFEEQVASTPGRIALIFEQLELGYNELNERANMLAHYLMKRGVTTETLVPICIEKSAEMIIGILAILKAGGAYVPLDGGYPTERINFMMEDIDARIIVTNKRSRAKLQIKNDIEIIEIDDDAILKEINAQPSINPSIPVQANQLAYIMYTSGSTGRPKGVLIEHRNVVSLVSGVDYVTISKEDVLLSTGSASFDATTFEYWAMLLNGGRLVLCSENKLLDAALLKDEIAQRNVTRMWFTSSWFNQLVENDITLFEGLKTILVGGEKLSEYHIRKMRSTYPSIEIINGYGPTENTTFSLTYKIDEIEKGRSIPIGKPFSNRSAYIFNEDRQLVPVGVIGEIYLGGAGISRGYLNREEMTNEKFISNPFSIKKDSKLYKTGDLGRWLSDGNIEYLGRIDDQVKIRGFRIELEEINSVLQQSGLVSQSLIVAKSDAGGSKRLIGYIVPKNGFNKEAVTTHLRTRLPEYMVPGVWVDLETMPLTSNGKIDKKALPDPDAGGLSGDKYVAPRNELEASLVTIWKKLLRVEQIGVQDNFFDAGGHSLLAMRLLSSIRREFNVDVPLVDIFDSTIESLAGKIHDQQASTKSNAGELMEEADIALSINEAGEVGKRIEAGIEWGANANGKYMIPINKNGTKIPFFGIISFNSYRLLSKYMTNDQPLYYLPPTQAASVEDIAAHYVKEIKQSQPSGPYLIGGFCGGGKIAMEVVQQMQAQGDQVLALVLFETYSPRAALSRKTLKYKKRKLSYYKDRILNITKSGHSGIDLVKFAFKKSYDKFKKPFAKPEPPKFITSPAYNKYVYKPYNGKVILFQASVPPLDFNDSAIMGWKGYFTGEVDMIKVKGGHLGIFREPDVEKLAEKLNEVLEEVNHELKPH